MNDQAPPSSPPAACNPVLDRITRAYPRLSRAERQVADFVLANPLAFTRTPISRITSNSGASAPTILRFCRAAGFSGLTDLKLSMVAVLGNAAPQAGAGDSGPGAGLLDTAGQLLDGLRQQLHGGALRAASGLLAEAPAVTCMASHPLAAAATYARDCLLRHGVRALTPDSPAYPGAPAGAAGCAALGLFFCFGVPEAALVDAITRYRRHGKGAIVISNVPVEHFVAPTVAIPVGPEDAAPPSACLLPHLLLTDLLVEASSRRRLACLRAAEDGLPQ